MDKDHVRGGAPPGVDERHCSRSQGLVHILRISLAYAAVSRVPITTALDEGGKCGDVAHQRQMFCSGQVCRSFPRIVVNRLMLLPDRAKSQELDRERSADHDQPEEWRLASRRGCGQAMAATESTQ